MGAAAAEARPSLVERVAQLTQHVRYSIARSPEEREEVFKLRYEGYRRADSIPASFGRRFSDEFDELDNAYIFAVRIDGQLVGTFRVHLLSSPGSVGPTAKAYADIIDPFLAEGQVLIEGGRFVVDPEAAKEYPELLYITLRMPVVASEHFVVDQTLATVRPHHQAFYQRIFGHRPISEPRVFPNVRDRGVLMSTPFQEIRTNLYRRYPFFQSTDEERKALFGTESPAPLGRRPRTPALRLAADV